MKVQKFAYIAERDIDFLLVEEISVNREFAAWVCSELVPDRDPTSRCASVRRSVVHSVFGESDIEVVYENGFALLIENKIDAPPQPEQALRYRKRGEQGYSEGRWQRFLTCIVAPEEYLAATVEDGEYDAKLSYERIQDWFRRQENRRADYRAHIINEAIEQNRRGYVAVPNDDVTTFWRHYWELANHAYPELGMQEPGVKPAKADWPDFRPRELGNAMNIVHKMAQGCVDLQIRHAADRRDEIRGLVKDPELQVVLAGNSTAIRIPVPKVDRFGNFKAQQAIVSVALRAARQLLHLASHLRGNI